MLSVVLNSLETSYRYAFAYIVKTNTASLRATQACGFQYFKEINITGVFRRLEKVEDGEYYVYRKAGRTSNANENRVRIDRTEALNN